MTVRNGLGYMANMGTIRERQAAHERLAAKFIERYGDCDLKEYPVWTVAYGGGFLNHVEKKRLLTLTLVSSADITPVSFSRAERLSGRVNRVMGPHPDGQVWATQLPIGVAHMLDAERLDQIADRMSLGSGLGPRDQLPVKLRTIWLKKASNSAGSPTSKQKQWQGQAKKKSPGSQAKKRSHESEQCQGQVGVTARISQGLLSVFWIFYTLLVIGIIAIIVFLLVVI